MGWFVFGLGCFLFIFGLWGLVTTFRELDRLIDERDSWDEPS